MASQTTLSGDLVVLRETYRKRLECEVLEDRTTPSGIGFNFVPAFAGLDIAVESDS